MSTAHLTTEQLAERFHVAKRTVDNWRQLGKGPRWIKAERRVLYPLAEVEAYEAAGLVGAAA